jgi:uncharacterized protein (DUF169 family)
VNVELDIFNNLRKEFIKMSYYNELGQELTKLLRLKILPLGVKLFEKIGDIPKDFEVTDRMWALCAVIGMARYYEKPIATTKDTATGCAMGGVSLGFYDPPPSIADGSRNAGIWAENKEAAKKLVENMNPIKRGQFEAVGFAPLNIMSVEPDVVQVWGTPVQVLALVYANSWDGSNNIELSTSGHGASCYEVLTVPYNTGRPRLAIADIGDRRFAYAADDEMIMGIPIDHLERLVSNLKKTYYQGSYKFPYEYHFPPIWEGALKRTSALTK